MLESKSRRGRPKGTGIDDSDRIAQLAELIRNKPDLKPTTAIKTMGITNPSVIRRLRDKYKAHLRSNSSAPAFAPVSSGPAAIAAAQRSAAVSRH